MTWGSPRFFNAEPAISASSVSSLPCIQTVGPKTGYRGFKIHVSPMPQDAEIVARSVLPKLRALNICHKVVRNLEIYMEQMATPQRGKEPASLKNL
jgi:hypothetical protein